MPWPALLPPLAITDNYSETVPEGYFESENDGPKKRRPKPTADNELLTFSQYYTAAQKDFLKVFYHQTLSGGTLAFQDYSPTTEIFVSLRFHGPLQFAHLGGNLYRVNFQLEILP